MAVTPVPVLWVCGPPAVGKSTVAWEIYMQVLGAGLTAAYVDLAQVGACRPAPADDPDHHRLKARNVGLLWQGYRSAGARCLILSGGVTEPGDIRRYGEAVPGAVLTVCRLRAGRDRLTERVLRRGNGDGPGIPGNELSGMDAAELHRFAEAAVRVAEELDRNGIGDLCVDTGDRSVADIATLVREVAGGWPALR